MKKTQFEINCEMVDTYFKSKQILKIADVCEILHCSLVTARKNVKAMLAVEFIFEINSFAGRRFVREKPEDAGAAYIREFQERKRLAEKKKNKIPMVFLSSPDARQGNRVFSECLKNSQICQFDRLLRSARP